MRVLLADDEPVALERLELALSCVPHACLVATGRNGKDALTLIRQLKPDVAVLDVQMPVKDGFGVIESLKSGEFVPEIIFVTAFHEHAIRAFDIQAVDYLLKPVAFERFREALRRAKSRLDARASDARFAELQRLLDTLRCATPAADRATAREIWVQERGELINVPVETIDRIEADGDYVRLHVGETSYLVKDTIASMEARLGPAAFVRVHRSSIVNLAGVRSIRRRTPRGLCLILTGGVAVTIGPSYANEVMRRVQAHRWRSA